MNQDTNVDEKLNSDWKRSVNFSCLWFLRKVLWRQGGASNDLVDTMAAEMTDKVLHFAGWCHDVRGDAEILNRCIAYLAQQHDGPWKGTDWFVESITLLIELAVPNNGLDEESAEFLNDLQVGVRQSLQGAPISRSELRISDDMAKDIQILRDAASEYGLVHSMLELIETLFHGESLEEYQRELLLIAATSAPFSRNERIERKIDLPPKK